MRQFISRDVELARLEAWWQSPAAGLGLVWGRRRVGKTALLQRFAAGKRPVFHTGTNRPRADELRAVSRRVAEREPGMLRDLEARPFVDWQDCLETVAGLAHTEPLLLVLDELPELVKASPELPSVLRAFWDRARHASKLRILICGSAVHTMRAIQEERAPLYGRFDLQLLVHPFSPGEAAEMLKGLKPAERALVWGLVGGMPLYLEMWDTSASVRKNLEHLVCTPGGRLLVEGEYVLATEGSAGELTRQVLFAIAAGRTKFNEIEQAVRTNPARVLDDLVRLRLVRRLTPVTEAAERTRRKLYQIEDNFLAFWLGLVNRYRAEIERGLGRTILPVLMSSLDDYMGPRFEEAYRGHLRHMAASGELGAEVVAVGPYWNNASPPVEVDALVLAGQAREAILIGEAKWAKRVDGRALRSALEQKAASLPRKAPQLIYSVCARERVINKRGILSLTAADIFRTPRHEDAP